MKKAEIKVGGLYLAKISGKMVTVRVDRIRPRYEADHDTVAYEVTNLSTGRKVTFRSAAKFRGETHPEPKPNPGGNRNMPSDIQFRQMVKELEQEIAADTARANFNPRVQDAIESAPVEVSEETDPTVMLADSDTASVPDVEGEQRPDPTRTIHAAYLAPSAGTSVAGTVAPVSNLASKIAAARQTRTVGTAVAGMTPNDEQESILAVAADIDAASECGRVLVVGAGAGTGKTATLKMLEQVLSGRGQYTAFNTALVAESKAKFRKARCNTTHSLAFHAVGKLYQARLDKECMRSGAIARILGITDQQVTLKGQGAPDADGKPTDKVKTLSAEYLAGQVMVAIKKFCMSADREMTVSHLKYIDGIDVAVNDPRRPGETMRGRENNDRMKEYLLPYYRKAWDDLTRLDGQLPFAHDIYVKLWQLGTGNDRPIIAADYILLDEAQDTAPVFLDILMQQTHALLVLVGDDNQQIYCQPEGTKVVKTERSGRAEWSLTEVPIETLRIGDTVMSYSQTYRLGRLTKKGCRVSAITTRRVDEDLIAVRTSGHRSSYTKNHHCVVMLGSMLSGLWVVYMQRSGRNYRVGCCKGVYESQMNQIGPLVRAKQENADAIWILETFASKTDALAHERSLLSDFPGRCFLSSGGEEWWEFHLSNEQEATHIATAYDKDINEPLLNLGEEWVDKSRTPIVTAARNLVNGMLMLVFANVPYDEDDRGHTVRKQHWTSIEVSTFGYHGNVVSISVDGDHTYVADGIVTHNCWRGAVNAMGSFPDAPRRLLSQSYRFGQAIADVANTVLATLDEPTDLVMRGNPDMPSRVDVVDNPRCYLYRTNAGAIHRVMVSLKEGKKPHLIGGGADVVAWCQAAADLQAKRPTRHPELCCFDSWGEVVEYSKSDEGGDLRLMVKLVTEFGAEAIRDALKDMPKEEHADLVVSTAHKSKGREWKTVKLGPDFPLANKMSDSDRRLLYVAATRAQHTLDISDCPPFCGGEDGVGEQRRFVPGLEIQWTQTMPTYSEQAAVLNAPKKEVVPTPSVNGHSHLVASGVRAAAAGRFTWCKFGDRWCARGPVNVEVGTMVAVERRDGSKQEMTLKSVVHKYDDAWIYGV